jgi:hypothetical protein
VQSLRAATGLTCPITAHHTAHGTSARLALIAPGRPVQDMPALTGVDRLLHSHPTPHHALNS